MKSLAIVIGLPALSIIVVSLFAMGGVERITSLVLLVASISGLLVALVRGRRVTSEKP